MTISSWTFFLLFSTFIVLALSGEEKPDMVVVLSRHGAREPLSTYIDRSWQNPSDLMNIGVEQHYALGRVLRKKYAHLLHDISPSEMYLQSTDTSRTQMSVSAELVGMFGDLATNIAPQANLSLPFADEKLVDQVINQLSEKKTMIPNRLMLLHPKYSHLTKGEILQVNPSNCKAVAKGQEARLKDMINRKMTVDMASTIRELRRLKYRIYSVHDLKEMGDVLANRFIANKPPLEGIPYNGNVFKDTVFAFKWWNMYNLVGTKLERSLRVFPIYSKLIEWFSGKVQGNHTLKLAIIGGHESTMFPFLSLYNISEHACFYENYKSRKAGQPEPFPNCEFPEYGSQLIYEFYNKTDAPYIRLLYNGKPRKFCAHSPGVECTLEQFAKEKREVLGGLTAAIYEAECDIKQTVPTTTTTTTTTSTPSTPKKDQEEKRTETQPEQKTTETPNTPKTTTEETQGKPIPTKKITTEQSSIQGLLSNRLILFMTGVVAFFLIILAFIIIGLITGKLMIVEPHYAKFSHDSLEQTADNSAPDELDQDTREYAK